MKKSKYLNITHNETGKTSKVLWDKEEGPTEADIDKIFEHEEQRKMPVKDPAYQDFSIKKISNPFVQPEAEIGDDANTEQQTDEQSQGDDEDSIDSSQEDSPNYLDYHKSVSDLSEDPENYGHLLSTIKHAKANGVKGEQLESLLTAHGIDPERIKVAKDLVGADV